MPRAVLYGEAAGHVADFDAESPKTWLLVQAVELYDQGNEFEDNAALADAVSLYRQCLDLTQRARAARLGDDTEQVQKENPLLPT